MTPEQYKKYASESAKGNFYIVIDKANQEYIRIPQSLPKNRVMDYVGYIYKDEPKLLQNTSADDLVVSIGVYKDKDGNLYAPQELNVTPKELESKYGVKLTPVENGISNPNSYKTAIKRDALNQYYKGDLDELVSNFQDDPSFLKKLPLDKRDQVSGLINVYLGTPADDSYMSTNKYFNEFNSIIDKQLQYENELGGESPSVKDMALPEFNRRSGVASSAFGLIKDVTSLPARALRSGIEELMPLSEQYTFPERMAMPEKYKTGMQQMGDELLSFTNAPNLLAGKAIRGTSNVLPVVGPNLSKGINTLMGRTPANVILGGGEQAQKFVPSMLRSIAKDAPAIATDIGYEATKNPDEQSYTGSVALGSLLGHVLPTAVSKKFGTPQSTLEWIAPKSYLKSQLEPFNTKAYMDYPSTLAIQGGPMRNINKVLDTKDVIVDYNLYDSYKYPIKGTAPFKGTDAKNSVLRDMESENFLDNMDKAVAWGRNLDDVDSDIMTKLFYNAEASNIRTSLPITPEIAGARAVRDAPKFDSFYKNVAEATLNRRGTKSAEYAVYENIVNTVKNRLHGSGKKLDVDFITPSVMNAISKEGFWKAANPSLSDGIINRLTTMAKEFTTRGVFDNTTRKTIASFLKNYIGKDDFTRPAILGDLTK